MIRLLIADDEEPELNALAHILTQRFDSDKLTMRKAHNGREAVDIAVIWGADVVLMDIEMPGINGLKAARTIQSQRSTSRIIFITAYSLFQYAHEAVRLGVCDYLLKPVNPDELEASVRRAIRQIKVEHKLVDLASASVQCENTSEVWGNQMALVMDQVRCYMEDNYMLDLSLDSISDILRMSPAYLSVQFKKYQHINFLDYLTELRINAAKKLLDDPFRSTSEVASMVGYEDASYFSRAFKKRTGMTPTQYRKSAAKLWQISYSEGEEK